jgi:hypothetical protein
MTEALKQNHDGLEPWVREGHLCLLDHSDIHSEMHQTPGLEACKDNERASSGPLDRLTLLKWVH